MTLYEIDKAILDCVDLETGEVLDTAALDALQMEKREKIGNIAAYIKNLTAEAKALKEEADNLTARRTAAENKVKRLKDYLMQSLNGEKYKDSRVSVYYGKSAEAVKIADEKEFIEWASSSAPEYLTYTPSINKTAVKEAIQSGLELSRATLEATNYIVVR